MPAHLVQAVPDVGREGVLAEWMGGNDAAGHIKITPTVSSVSIMFPDCLLGVHKAFWSGEAA